MSIGQSNESVFGDSRHGSIMMSCNLSLINVGQTNIKFAPSKLITALSV